MRENSLLSGVHVSAVESLNDIDCGILNGFQGGFPVVEKPFYPASDELSRHGVVVEPYEMLERLQKLEDQGYISRFGALIDAEEIGGTTVLVATTASDKRFDEVIEVINSREEVAHNYERDHRLNIWFVVSVSDRGAVEDVLNGIEEETGVETYSFPKIREFHLGAHFPVKGPLADESEDIDLSSPPSQDCSVEVDEESLLAEIHDGFPLSPTPYADIAESLGVGTDAVVSKIRHLNVEDKIRRIGVIPNHYAIGYTENAMTVWDIPDDTVAEVGEDVGSLPFVTHCYERPRHGDIWRYNLFAMVHGRNEDELERRVKKVREAVEETIKVDPETWDRLVSTQVLKKTGINIQSHDSE